MNPPQIGYPVEVAHLYEDYEPFGNQDTRAFSDTFFYKSREEADLAETRFQAAGAGDDLLEVTCPFPDGVVHNGAFNSLETVEEDLLNLKKEKAEAN